MEIELTDSNFEKEVLERSKKIPVVVDFWGETCPHCLILMPVLEKLAKAYNGKFILAKANVNEAGQKAEEYGVMGIPDVKLFKGGKIVDEFVGSKPEADIKKWLDKNL